MKVTLYGDVPAVARVTELVQPNSPVIAPLTPVAEPEAGLSVELDSAVPAMAIDEAAGQVMPVGVAWFTTTVTNCPEVVVTAPYKLVLVGVKVTLNVGEPAPGLVVEALSLAVQAKVPGTLWEPPVRIELLSACPKVIDEAEGHEEMMAGTAWTAIFTVPVAVV